MKDLLLALGGPKASSKSPAAGLAEEDKAAGMDEEGSAAAAQDIIDAIQAGDASRLSEALNAFIDLR